MAIVKSDLKGQYFIVGMDIARDQNMNLAERGMMLTLLSLPPEWRYSNEGMVHILPDGKQKVCNAMKSLIEKGYVKRIQSRSVGGAFGDTVIEVFHKAIIIPDSEGKTQTVLPSPEKRMTANRPQVNNHISNNNKYNNYKKKGSFHNFHEREYTKEEWNEIERRLLMKGKE